ncbi:hypothetical protein KP509_06G088000 [Ceratopteris richardii]|uniref:Uncharacterized protein n=1 Tax=Ceratopteris richardii TaxID=49495 RepID=A0A8T2URI9_CERRI|nr:hypothetical protein KP509_06G088000 [Ceratopteris richardii]
MELHFAFARGSSVSTLTVTLTVYQCMPLPDKLRTPARPESTSPSSSPLHCKCAEAKIMPIYKDDARIGTGTSHSYVSLSRSSFFFPPSQGAPFCEPACIFLGSFLRTILHIPHSMNLVQFRINLRESIFFF